MDILSLESIAVTEYETLKLKPHEPCDTFTIARKKRVPITRRGLVGARPGSLWWVNGQPRITVRPNVPIEFAQHVVGHELAHLILGRAHDDGDGLLEATCDYLGACLMAPRPAVLALYREHEWDLRKIASEVVATQTWAALRVAEALRVPLAAVSPQAVRVRGPEEWQWPSENEIRRMARSSSGPGLRRVRITDQPGRTALVPECECA